LVDCEEDAQDDAGVQQGPVLLIRVSKYHKKLIKNLNF
jgi:hypothetical protein